MTMVNTFSLAGGGASQFVSQSVSADTMIRDAALVFLWILFAVLPAGTDADSSNHRFNQPPDYFNVDAHSVNSLEESSVTVVSKDNASFPLRVFIGYSSNPWGASSELEPAPSTPGPPGSRKPKRSVVHLYNMVLCATGCNPLAYKGYGCYCGFLGSGYTMDPIDSCCKMHDWCYSTADCPMFLEYFVPYYWTCYRHRPLCALGASCGQRLCECDRRLAECLSHYPCPRSKAVCTSSPWRLLQNLLML